MTEPLINDQIFIRKLTDIVCENLCNENFGVNELAVKSGISIYRLNRKLHSINKKTANQFIREIRLQKALEMLQNETYTASEIAFKVGFGSPTYFTKSFHEFYGYPPGKAKDRINDTPEPNILTSVSGDIKAGRPSRRTYILTLSVILSFILLAGMGTFLIFRKFGKPEWTERLITSGNKSSFAVMPFQNLTNDTTWNKWQYLIQSSLISTLANSGEIEVRQIESVKKLLQAEGLTEYASIPPGITSAISKKLEADMFICGNLQLAGSRIRIDAQLIETKTNKVLQSFQTNGLYGREETILDLTDSLKIKIMNFLLISKLIKENPRIQHLYTQTRSVAALRNFVSGDKAYYIKDYSLAKEYFLKALAADSNYNIAALMIEKTLSKEGKTTEQFQWLIRNYQKRDHMDYAEQLYASWAYAFHFDSPFIRLKYLKELQSVDDQEPNIPYLLGYTYNRIERYEKAIPELEKSLNISRKWGEEYLKDVGIYLELGDAYHKTFQYRKEKRLYRMAEKYIPDEPWILRFQARLALSRKDSMESNRYLEKYISVLQKNSSTEGTIAAGLAWIYSMAGIPDKAEEYYRKSVYLEPGNPLRLQNFASFLINKNRHLEEIQELMDRAMELAPNKYDYSIYSDTKGWGLYKQGKYKEALEILDKTWEEAPFPLYSIKSHLEEVKRAVAGQSLRFPW